MAEEPRRIEKAADGLDQLKTLLFQGESRRLDEVERAVDHLGQRVGDAPRLERATAEIIVGALRDAEVARHAELASAIAPVVVAAIRNEIRNSREMMVEALYPLTGQMVVAAVQNAFRELVVTLNRQLDALTSFDRWKLRVRSKLTGRPVSELALARTTRGHIVRVLFLENGGGRVIASWRTDAGEDDNADLVAGLIAAITGFAREALDAGANDLRTLDLGGREIFLRGSPRTIVAAEIEGELTRRQVAALDEAFLALLGDFARDESLDSEALARFAARVDDAGVEPKKQGIGLPLKIAACLVVAALAALSWRAGTRFARERKIDAALASVVAARPALVAYPLALKVDHGSRRVEIRGLLPSGDDALAIAAALKEPAGDYSIASALAVVATPPGLDALGQRGEEMTRELAALSGRAAEMERRLAAAVEGIDALARRGASADQVLDLQARMEAMARSGASLSQVEELRGRVEAVASAGAPASLVADMRARVDALVEAGAETRRLNESVARLGEKVGGLVARVEAPRARLRALVEGFAIFFTDREKFADEAGVLARLDAISGLLISEHMGIRVAGYTDALGSAAKNLEISRNRAMSIADLLEARGVDRKRIVIVGRSAGNPVAEQDPATRERNRRVTLEPLYENEAAP